MRQSIKILVVTSIATLSLIGCNKKESAPAPVAEPAKVEQKQEQAAPAPAAAAAVSEEVKKEAAETFATRCMPCHGAQGKGDGPASAGLTPPPRNFSDGEWQKSVTDEHIEKIIAYGGAAVGKSPAMPPNPDLADKPVIQGLRAHIRDLAGK